MNELVNYAIESGICLAVLFALYWLLLRNETYFQFNRIYLLGAVAISLLLPFGHLPILMGNTSALASLPQITASFQIPELNVEDASVSTKNPIQKFSLLIAAVYLLGTFLLWIRMSLGIIRVHLLRKRGQISRHRGYSVVFLKQEVAPFSFLRTIYLSREMVDSPDKDHIIQHELVHVRQGHSLDNLFMEFFLALFWVNPFMWFTKSALRDTHEYIADSDVVKTTTDTASYQTLLLKQIAGFFPIVGTNNFNTTIKNRINMMCKNRSSVFAKLKPLLIVPVLAFLTFLISCEDKTIFPNDAELIEPEDPTSESAENEEVFFIVEEMPQFNGGDPAMEFRKYIAQNLKYPEVAEYNRIQGRVIVQFAVNKEGDVVDAIVVRSVDPSLDKEAIRVVMSSPKWTPGEQGGKKVKVLFTFPLNFVLQ